VIDGGHVANAPLPTLQIPNSSGILGFSVRARFENFLCDAVHSAVKLRPARFDTAVLAQTFGFCLRQIGGKHAGAAFFGNHMHHTQARLLQTPMELGREPINSEWSADVRIAARYGLNSDMELRPKSAQEGTFGQALLYIS
jgi:hypothetical protein